MPTSRFTMTAAPAVETAGDLLVLPFRDGTPMFDARQVPRAVADCRPAKKAEMLPVRLSDRKGERTAVCMHRMAGDGGELVREVKKMVYTALAKARELQLKRVVVALGASYSYLATAVQEGALLGGYAFDRYRKKKKKSLPVVLICDASPGALKKGAVVARFVNDARDLLNEPPAVMNPQTLSAAFEESGVQSGLVVETWTQQKLEAERCGGILAVGGGSAVPPRLVIGRYIPDQPKLHLALVGKGITFDSGGYSIKPTKSMEDMKMDMAGAAAMWSAACAIASLRLPLRLTVYCPLAHNAISGTA